MDSTRATAVALATSVLLAGGLAWAGEVAQNRPVTGFDRITLAGSMDAQVRVGEAHSVTVIADETAIDRIVTEVKDGKLVIKQKSGAWRGGGADVEITLPELTAFAINGSGDADITAVDSEALTLAINGSGDLDVAGRCGASTIAINGSGDIDAQALKCDTVAVTVNGAGDADVYADEQVEVTIRGSADVTVHGNPDRVIPRSIAGSGSFTMADGR